MNPNDFWEITDDAGRHFLFNLNNVAAIIYLPGNDVGPLSNTATISFHLVDESAYSFSGPQANVILTSFSKTSSVNQ